MNLRHMSKSRISNLITFALVLAFYIIMQTLSGMGLVSNSLQGQLVPICTYIILAISLNLTVGILGELSLGHAGFMSVGAFAGSFFSVCAQEAIPAVWVRFPLALLIGGVAAGLAGVIIGVPVLRLRGDYLAIVTLAFGEIIKNLFNSFYFGVDSRGVHFSMKDSLALGVEADGAIVWNGAQGITGTPKDATFTVGIVLIFITLFIVLNVIKSRTGRAIMSIRDNRIAAESIGIPVTKYKMIAFALSAALAGIAGVLYSHNFSTLVAKKFDYNMSILILVFVVVGGMGNIRGSIFAAALLTVLPELLRGIGDYRMLIYAIILILMMIFTQSPKLIAWRAKIMAKLPRFSLRKPIQAEGKTKGGK